MATMSDYFPDTLDTLPLFRRTDPVTSKLAGVAAREFRGDHERKILEALAAGPGTKDELAARCGLSEQQVARRMHGLARAGLVETTGTTRPSASGRPERVWKATAASL
jgi:predicted ArsR family transcriptional regulator